MAKAEEEFAGFKREPGSLPPKPAGNVFNALQFVALGALIASVALLWMALSDYGFKITGN